MTLKIAIGGIEHETNTFSARNLELSDINCERGQSIIGAHAGVQDYVGGMLDAASGLGATVVPTLLAVTVPGGAISATAYSSIVEDLLAAVKASLPVDAVALDLHGAGIAEKVGNIEVDICRRVREAVGPDVKIVITLDLHGNLSPNLAELVDAAFGTHNHPHTDMFERGQDAVNILPRLIDGSIKPQIHIEKLPFLMITATTMRGHAATINAMCRSIEEDPDIVTCTFFHGFAWADTPDTGPSVLVVANGDLAKAKAAAKRVAQFVWDSRAEMIPNLLSPAEAIKCALKSEDWPVALIDGSDCSGAGGPADGTHLLRAMLEANLSNACFAVICDPKVVAQCHQAGIGATVKVELGGKTDRLHGAPIAATARIQALTDGRFTRQSPMGKGREEAVGLTAGLQINGIDIVVISERYQPMDPGIFTLHGVDVSRCRFIGLKSLNHWRAGFAGIVKRDYIADSPGLMSRDLTSFSYKLVPRPVWPLDKEAVY